MFKLIARLELGGEPPQIESVVQRRDECGRLDTGHLNR